MPVILGPDGPSLGGFVCPATVIRAELLEARPAARPGDRVRFVPVSACETPLALEQRSAGHRRAAQRRNIDHARRSSPIAALAARRGRLGWHRGRLSRLPATDYLLVEYGPPVLDIAAALPRARADAAAAGAAHAGHPRTDAGHPLAAGPLRPALLPLGGTAGAAAARPSRRCGDIEDLEVPARIVHLPLSWDDPATRLAIEQVHAVGAPRRALVPEQHRVHPPHQRPRQRSRRCSASSSTPAIWCMGLGDVYLGAPVATPLDPRHRLVTTKYNPARTWTPENAVGIGGAYLCVYGMEGPGGYQFVGRTLQMWNRYRRTAEFDGKPWLLRFFDQIRFFPVSERRTAAHPRGLPARRATGCASRRRPSTCDAYDAFPGGATPPASPLSRRASRPLSKTSARRWIEAGQATYTQPTKRCHRRDRGRAECSPADRDRRGGHVHGSVWQLGCSRAARRRRAIRCWCWSP